MSKANFRVMREVCGLSQQDVADALGVRVLTVKRWERPGWPDPPADAWEYVGVSLDAHDAAVTSMAAVALARRDTDGVEEVAITYYRDQAQYDAFGRDPGPVGVVNARARSVGELLSREGFEVSYAYPDEEEA